MDFLIERDRLLEVLTKLASIIDSKAAIPILKNVFIDVGASAVFFRTTDTQLIMPCPAEVTAQGQITVDGKLLHEIVRQCPKGGQIGVTLGGASKRRKVSGHGADRLRLTNGKAEFSLVTLAPDDWPVMAIAWAPRSCGSNADSSARCSRRRASPYRTKKPAIIWAASICTISARRLPR
jgi:DNA polymerase III sliding clamp (beta) subunit (PCNA family)